MIPDVAAIPHHFRLPLIIASFRPGGNRNEACLRLPMTYPRVGPVTALAFVLLVGYPERFQGGKQIGNCIGLIPEKLRAVFTGWVTSAN